MGKRTVKSDSPLMYIAQPRFKKSSTKMQSTYKTNKQKPVEVEVEAKSDSQQAQKVKKVSIKKRKESAAEKLNEFENEPQIVNKVDQEQEEELQVSNEEPEDHYGDHNSEVEAVAEENEKKPHKNKRFKEMNIEEKLIYLSDTAPGIPKLKCEFWTNEVVYRGIVLSYNDEAAELKISTRPFNVTVPLEDFVEIKLLSL